MAQAQHALAASQDDVRARDAEIERLAPKEAELAQAREQLAVMAKLETEVERLRPKEAELERVAERQRAVGETLNGLEAEVRTQAADLERLRPKEDELARAKEDVARLEAQLRVHEHLQGQLDDARAQVEKQSAQHEKGMRKLEARLAKA